MFACVSGITDMQMREESEDENEDGQLQGGGRWRVEDVQKGRRS